MGKYFEVSVYNSVLGKKSTMKIESGVTFENKNFRYTMDNSGKLSIFDKNTKTTVTGKEIKLTDYQCRTLKAVADNVDDAKDGTTVLSAVDIETSINQYYDSPEKLREDLKEHLKGDYVVHNPKAFEEENKFSAYIKNGKEEESSVMAFKFDTEYFDTKIKNIKTGEIRNIKMEKGVSFENNGAIYRMNNDGLLAVYDKAKGQWLAGINEIKMTPYQLDTFEAVANNVKEKSNGKIFKETVYSKADILSSINMYKKSNLAADISEFLDKKGEYKPTQLRAYSTNTAFSAYVTNEKNSHAGLIFKYGSAQDVLDLSDYVHNNVFPAEQVQKNEKTAPQKASNQKASNQKAQKTIKKTVRTGALKEAKNMSFSNKALNLIKSREQLVLYTYDDLDKSNPRKFIKKGMKYKGTLTIGYGHTKNVKPGQKINQKKAEKLLREDIKKAEKAVRQLVKVKITQNQFDALVSFAFNVGKNAFEKSDLLKFINSQKFDSASAEFPRWRYSKGQVCRGLVNRRADERKLFDS